MLILGLLFALGLIALVAAFIISRSGDESATAKAPKVSQTAVSKEQTAREQTPVAEIETPKEVASTTQIQAGQSPQKAEMAEEEPPYIAVGGQLHEVTRQLRNLNEQSRELEERLSHLSTIMNSLEPEESDEEEVTLVDLPAITRNSLRQDKLTPVRTR